MKLQSTIQQTKITLLAALVSLAALQTGCAEHKTAFKDIAPHLPALQPGYARIYIYTVTGRQIQSFRLIVDGKVIGQINGHECSYVDHLPGNVDVVADLEGTGLMDSIGFVLAAGETRYVQAKKDMTITGKITLTAVNPDQAAADLDRCEYVPAATPGMTKQ